MCKERPINGRGLEVCKYIKDKLGVEILCTDADLEGWQLSADLNGSVRREGRETVMGKLKKSKCPSALEGIAILEGRNMRIFTFEHSSGSVRPSIPESMSWDNLDIFQEPDMG